MINFLGLIRYAILCKCQAVIREFPNETGTSTIYVLRNVAINADENETCQILSMFVPYPCLRLPVYLFEFDQNHKSIGDVKFDLNCNSISHSGWSRFLYDYYY